MLLERTYEPLSSRYVISFLGEKWNVHALVVYSERYIVLHSDHAIRLVAAAWRLPARARERVREETTADDGKMDARTRAATSRVLARTASTP